MAPHFDLHNTMGALFIGMVIATSLHGISIVQVYYYYTHQKDTWSIKSLVTAVMFCDTVHQALITHTVYSYVIMNWGDPEQLSIVTRTLVLQVLFNGLTAFFVQGFLTMRVWRLSNGNVLLTGLIILFVFSEFASSLAFTTLALRLDSFAQLVKEMKPLSLAVNILAASGDVLIAAALCILLHRSRTGFQRSDTIINKLILFAVNTGLLTSLFAVASFVSYMAAPNTFIYITFYFCIGRLYTNSLLATLNARKMISNLNASENIHSNTNDKLTLSLRELPKNGHASRRGAANISIKINTTKEFVTDLMQDQEDPENSKIEYLQTPSSSAAAGLEDEQ